MYASTVALAYSNNDVAKVCSALGSATEHTRFHQRKTSMRFLTVFNRSDKGPRPTGTFDHVLTNTCIVWV